MEFSITIEAMSGLTWSRWERLTNEIDLQDCFSQTTLPGRFLPI